ncbi:glycoside hydrolase family 31 protein [Atractiella rhizophila]|nr:glycoside hydrolase family 31 protein [Atractiella rhizophila]
MLLPLLLPLLLNTNTVSAQGVANCPGYNANITQDGNTFTGQLTSAGPCNVYGDDIPQLTLKVEYETGAFFSSLTPFAVPELILIKCRVIDTRLRVLIRDIYQERYEVPGTVFPRPSKGEVTTPQLKFVYTESPFSFEVRRTESDEILFKTDGPLVFADQYLRIATSLGENANIYGLGQHSETFRLPTENLTRTLWNVDGWDTPVGTNLYGSHPIYFEQRESGTHGVFLLSSNGMDVKRSQSLLEYNVIGGVFDFYFLAGPTPADVARQYAQIVGLPAEMPYWSYGFHQCRYGYHDWLQVANVVRNYSIAGIPLETMWVDIDYMDRRLIFTTDPDYFPLDRMRELVARLHENGQQLIQMVDPGIGVQPDYGTYARGRDLDVYLKESNGSEHHGTTWPGVVVWPDWFDPKATDFWTHEHQLFYNAETGIDIDGEWSGPPPRDGNPPPKDAPLPDWPVTTQSALVKRLPNPEYEQKLLNPPYNINNVKGVLSDFTAHVDTLHWGGLYHYDVHNLFGMMMTQHTYDALLARRPGLRPFIISRSSFAGSGRKNGVWTGDVRSSWPNYRNSIANLLAFSSLYQIPVSGADVCGFLGDTNEVLCNRWASLGAFYPFYRNHKDSGAASQVTPSFLSFGKGVKHLFKLQEFYLWESVTGTAKKAIDKRYRLLDYFYTHQHQQSVDGTPAFQPLWFQFPEDKNTYAEELQFLFGPSILVSPVVDAEDSTSVSAYLPNENWYDFTTYEKVEGGGTAHTFDVPLDEIKVQIKGGSIVPLRVESANTTRELRKKDFELLVPSLKRVLLPDNFTWTTASLLNNKGHIMPRSRSQTGHWKLRLTSRPTIPPYIGHAFASLDSLLSLKPFNLTDRK